MGGPDLKKLLPTSAGACSHVLGRWLLRTAKSTTTRGDGSTRPMGERGGRTTRVGNGCVYTPGHPGAHRTEDGRSWT
jgi:hypothetical protein